ncbi:MAG: TIR domain-containing protein [Hyphomonas sp.]
MTKIFISYRREDSQWQTKALYEALCACVPNPATDIFFDLDSMTVGLNFKQQIELTVDKCDVLIAVIGTNWLSAQDPDTGERRIDNPRDFVRSEIAAALRRSIPVIPVFIDGALPPEPDELPDDLKELSHRHGVKVRADSFRSDLEHLVRGLKLNSGPARAAKKPPKFLRFVGWALAAIFLAGLASLSFLQRDWIEIHAFHSDPHERRAWRDANADATIESMTSFLEGYPDSSHARAANETLQRLRDEAAWLELADSEDIEEFRSYLATFPQALHLDEAEREISRLEAEQAQRQEAERQRKAEAARKAQELLAAKDQKAWAAASEAKSSAEYKAYLRAFPNGLYQKEATQRLSECRTEEDASSNSYRELRNWYGMEELLEYSGDDYKFGSTVSLTEYDAVQAAARRACWGGKLISIVSSNTRSKYIPGSERPTRGDSRVTIETAPTYVWGADVTAECELTNSTTTEREVCP